MNGCVPLDVQVESLTATLPDRSNFGGAWMVPRPVTRTAGPMKATSGLPATCAPPSIDAVGAALPPEPADPPGDVADAVGAGVPGVGWTTVFWGSQASTARPRTRAHRGRALRIGPISTPIGGPGECRPTGRPQPRLTVFGSSASRRPSPMKFTPRTVSVIMI